MNVISQDLVARDEPLRQALEAEALTLPDIVLTEVRDRRVLLLPAKEVSGLSMCIASAM